MPPFFMHGFSTHGLLAIESALSCRDDNRTITKNERELVRTVILMMLLAWSATATAEIYQWTDSDGKVHYGDGAAKKPGQKAEKLKIETAAAKPDPEAERTRQQIRLMQKMSSEQREADARKTAKLQEQHQQLRQQCAAVQGRIRDEQSVAVMFRYDDAGNRILWTAGEREAYRAVLQAQKQEYCGDE
jgi:hypothetical protein